MNSIVWSFSGVTFPLGGIQVTVSIWTVALALLVILGARNYIQKHYPECPSVLHWSAGTIACVLTLLSLVLHEIMHGVAAHMVGIKITEAGMSFWGAYVKPETSILEVSPFIEILITLAGPFTNLVIAACCTCAVWYFGESLFENTVQYLGYINWIVFKLNMLPLFIFLDGGKALHGVLRLVFPETAALYVMIGVGVATAAWLLRRKRPAVGTRVEERLSEL